MKVHPRAGRNENVGICGDALKIESATPPVDRAAGVASVEFVAEILRVPQTCLHIGTGFNSRTERREIHSDNMESFAGALLPESASRSD